MEITFKKGNAKNSITCKREDGTTTWTEADAFMIAHDLTHYVVETVFSMKNGFYGLLDSGLDITDFEKKQKITPRDIPKEAITAETLVNLFLTEKNDGKTLENFDSTFNEAAAKLALSSQSFDGDKLKEARTKLQEVLSSWKSLPVGESLRFRWG